MAAYDDFVKGLDNHEIQQTIKNLENKGQASEAEAIINQFTEEYVGDAKRAENLLLLKQALDRKLFDVEQNQIPSANQVSVNTLS